MRDELRVMVATVAFGMGVHKEDVRLVVHMGLPRSIESWLQETGRAGRDALPASCHALVAPADYLRLHSLCHSDGVELEALQRLLAQLLRNCRNGYGEVAHRSLEVKLDMSEACVGTALALLAELPRRMWSRPAEAAEGEEGDAATAAAATEAEAEAPPQDWRRPAARPVAGAAHAAEQELPLLDMLPEIRRTAVLSFHQRNASPEQVSSRSELVAMLLKYGSQKPGTGAYHCPLVQASSELGLSAHDAHAQLLQLQAAGRLQPLAPTLTLTRTRTRTRIRTRTRT